jgi:hypothetical protein
MRVVSVGAVKRAVEATLQRWMPWTLLQVAEFEGRNPAQITQVRTWKRLPETAVIDFDQLPAIGVASSGLIGTPESDGDLSSRATWAVQVEVVVRGKSYDEVTDLVGLYAAAVRACLMQHPSLGGFADQTMWIGEDYAAVDATKSRTLGAAVVEVAVTVDDVLNIHDAPAVPPLLPTDPMPEPVVVESVHVDEDRLPQEAE